MKSKMIMEWLIENWFLILAILSCGVVGICFVFRFLGMPTEKQKKKVREWLVWACIEAERALQSGTGQLKLREVWNILFCTWLLHGLQGNYFFEEFSRLGI